MTNLVLRNPLTDLQREVDRLFEDFLPGNGDKAQSLHAPAVDFWETDESYVFAFDLPGMTRDAVEITYQDGMLQISGERTWNHRVGVQFHRVERPHGRFFRSLRLNRGVNLDEIRARFDEGVLTVEVPKAEEMKPRRIEIS